MRNQTARMGMAKRSAKLLLTPRWLAMGALVIIGFVTCLALAHWQWQRTVEIQASEHVALLSPIHANALPMPGDPSNTDLLGRRVQLHGQWIAATAAVIHDRSLDGRRGAWAIAGLRLDDGTVVAVNRGWVANSGGAATALMPGSVSVDGTWEQDEQFYPGAAAGTFVTMTSDQLARNWHLALRPGYVTLASQQPIQRPAPIPVHPTATLGEVSFPLQNFGYVLQWLAFGCFLIAAYARFAWAESHRGVGSGQEQNASGH